MLMKTRRLAKGSGERDERDHGPVGGAGMSTIDTSPAALRTLADTCWQHSSGNWAARAEHMFQALAKAEGQS
jgi:hypothetical protein